MPSIVTLTGTDGSGKTTLAAEVAEEFRRRGYHAQHIWLGAESVLMAPIRALLRRLRRDGSGKEDPNDYTKELERKRSVVARASILERGYVFLVLLDYRIQFLWKMWGARKADFVVADRFLFDVLVNIGVTLGWTDERIAMECRRRLINYGPPLLSKYVNVPIEVAMARKDDIPDRSYIEVRRSPYDALARELAFDMMSGEVPPGESARLVVDEALELRALRRVFYVHSNNVDVGGADFVMQRQVRYLSSKAAGNDRVRPFVFLRLHTRIVESYTQSGLPVHLANIPRPSGRVSPLQLLRSLVGLVLSVVTILRAIRAVRPHLIHVNDVYDIGPALAGRLARVPVIYHIRMFPNSRTRRRVLGSAIRFAATQTVSVSEAVRRGWFTPIRRDRDNVAWDIADQRLLDRPPESSRHVATPLVFAMVGRLEPWKGQHIFLEAIGQLADDIRSRAEFQLIGGSVPRKEEYFAECARKANGLGVEFLGERNDVPSILQRANVVVHCSLLPDPLPGVVIEGVLSGRYVIATRAGGVPEILAEGGGQMVRPNSAEDLARLMKEIITRPDVVGSITPRAYQFVASRVSPDAAGSAIASIYRKALELDPQAEK